MENVKGKRQVRVNFREWWFNGGREYIDQRFSVRNYEWRYISSTDASLKEREYEDAYGPPARTSVVKLVVERIMNERLQPQIDDAFTQAVNSGKVSIEYKPFEYIDPNPTPEFRTWLTDTYPSGAIKEVRQKSSYVVQEQEWYENGSPKLAIIKVISTRDLEKRVWHENGQPKSHSWHL